MLTEFIETELGPLLVYELGVVAFSADGVVRWTAKHATLGCEFIGVRDELVCFENIVFGSWGYRLDTGECVGRKPS
jgi:hypothetical protein